MVGLIKSGITGQKDSVAVQPLYGVGPAQEHKCKLHPSCHGVLCKGSIFRISHCKVHQIQNSKKIPGCSIASGHNFQHANLQSFGYCDPQYSAEQKLHHISKATDRALTNDRKTDNMTDYLQGLHFYCFVWPVLCVSSVCVTYGVKVQCCDATRPGWKLDVYYSVCEQYILKKGHINPH